MKIYFKTSAISFIFISILNIFYSQDINVLDEKNGYKIFKLNSDKSDYVNNLTFIESKNGYSTYNYSYKEEYMVEYDTIILENSKNTLESVARYFKTSVNVLKSLNKDLVYVGGQVGENRLKKGQVIIYPINKISKKHLIDTTLFDLFGKKINSIQLTFDSNTDKLKKINLNLDRELTQNHQKLIPWELKKLYFNFANIIGPTTNYEKPPKDCFNPNINCNYFDVLAINGEISWLGEKTILNIFHMTEINFDNSGNLLLNVFNSVVFSSKEFIEIEKKASF